jgi:hypothetical protein
VSPERQAGPRTRPECAPGSGGRDGAGRALAVAARRWASASCTAIASSPLSRCLAVCTRRPVRARWNAP